MIFVAICDDDDLFLNSLNLLLRKKYENEIIFKTYTRCRDLLHAIEFDEVFFDGILMDVKFDDGDGIEIIKRIQRAVPKTKVVYITGYIETSMRIFETKPSNFLVKPIEYSKVMDAIEKMKQEILMEEGAYITIHTTERTQVRVAVKEIRYIESDKRRLILNTEKGKYGFYGVMNEFEAELARTGEQFFVRCHQSYLLNMHYIFEKRTTLFVLTTGEKIPISRSRYEETENIQELFRRYIMDMSLIDWYETALESLITVIFALQVLKPKLKAGLTVVIWEIYYFFIMWARIVIEINALRLLHRFGIHMFDNLRVFFALTATLGTFLAIVFLFKGSIWKKIFLEGEILAITIALEVIMESICYCRLGYIMLNAPKTEQYIIRTVSPVWYSSFSIILLTLQSRQDRKETILMISIQLLLLLSEMVFVFMLFLGARDYAAKHIFELNLLVFLPAIAVNYLSSLVLQHLSRLRERETKLAFAEEMGEKEYAYYQLALENENTLREMRHEIANQLQMMEALLQMGEDERAGKIANDLTNRFQTVGKIRYCDNQIVNIILSIKADEAKSRGILLENKVMPVLGKLEIEDMDLSIILTNLLDNAIRASGETAFSSKNVLCEIGCKQGHLIIRASNATKMKAGKEQLPEFETTKEDKMRHGVGLVLVRKVVKKYEGSFDIELKEEKFTATVMI